MAALVVLYNGFKSVTSLYVPMEDMETCEIARRKFTSEASPFGRGDTLSCVPTTKEEAADVRKYLEIYRQEDK